MYKVGRSDRIVRTGKHNVKLTFIHRFSSNRNAFYLCTVTSEACSSTPYYAHAWLYKGCGYCQCFSVPCRMKFRAKNSNVVAPCLVTTVCLWSCQLRTSFKRTDKYILFIWRVNQRNVVNNDVLLPLSQLYPKTLKDITLSHASVPLWERKGFISVSLPVSPQ